MTTMQAAFLKVPFQFEVREVAVPEVRPGWALVKVQACGICGTDMHYARHLATTWQGFGHEVAGMVAAVGAGITHIKEGDAVVLESGSYCGVCDLCRNGRIDLCNNAPNFWTNPTMGFADYILAPAQALVPYDAARLTPQVACLAEPLGVALDILYTADVRLGDEVLVLGLGPIGLMMIPLVRMRGAAHIYAANRSGGKRSEAARQLGVDTLIMTNETPLKDATFRRGGVDRALVSASPAALVDAMPIMRYGGVIAFIGIEFGEGARISFDVNDFHFKKLQLRASHAAPALFFPTCLQLMMDGQIDGQALISHTLPLSRIGEAMALVRDARDEVLKVVITPGA